MSSILTNTGAMTALQTLNGINKDLAKTQDMISTGKKISSAKDNAAVFAISKVMESDVAGFKSLSDSLSLGKSTVAVAANAAESIGSLLEEIKGKIVAANEDNVDRQKLQDEVQSLVGQIDGIVSSAQFNGLNLLDGSADGTGGFSVLSSLDRDSAGTVTTNSIQFDPTDTNLSTASGTDLQAGTSPAGTEPGATVAAGATESLGAFDVLDAAGAPAGAGNPVLARDAVDLTAGTAEDALVEGDEISLTLGDNTARYSVQVGDTSSDIVAALRQGLIAEGVDQNDFTLDVSNTAGTLEITNNTTVDETASFTITRDAGGLANLDTIDVSTATGAQAALTDIEGYIQNAVDAQAQLGTTEKRLDIQNDFMSSLIDSFKTGIGSLVDANMEAASARLQALQVQQQLGTQALSIANQAPQNILSLFR